MAPKDRQPPDADDPGATGSIDVQFSGSRLPRAETVEDDDPTRPAGGLPPGVTGSMDVQFSSTTIPTVSRDPAASGSVDVQMSQSMPAARPAPARRRRSTTVPGMIGESLSNLPVVKEVMPKTRKGRLLLRSMVVAFTLIGVWIGVIVYLQLRGETKPDLRPQVEAIFADLRDARFEEVYEHASERFQELTLFDSFEERVKDQNRTVGKFIEVAAVIRTETFRGPSGRTARADLLLDFENGRCTGSMSFIFEDGQWRMLGFRVELPEELWEAATSSQARADRVQAPQEVRDLAVHILEQSREGRSDQIWDEAAKVFQDSVTKEKFRQLEDQRRATLGPFRVLHVTQAHQDPSATGANVEGIATYGDTSLTQAVSLKFKKIGKDWKLTFYKVILPMPRGRPRKP